MKPLKFKHPVNGYILEIERPVLFAFLLGPLFFAAKGVWKPLIFCGIAFFLTAGISIFFQIIILPIYARDIFRTHFLSRGWTDVTDQTPEEPIKRIVQPTTQVSPTVPKKTDAAMTLDDRGIPTYKL